MYAGLPVGQPKKKSNGLLLALIISLVLLVAILTFAIWAYLTQLDYKQNVKTKVSAAVKVAQQTTATTKDKEFAEKEKNPLREYRASQSAGNLSVIFPKTWSAFINEATTSGTILDAYMHPGFVPGLQSGTDFALRVRVVSKSYDQEVKQYESKASAGKVTISPYSLPKMGDDIVGVRIDGEINAGQQDSMVLFPLRDKTIEISTESAQFLSDFDTIVLANLTFTP